ncbi:MAG: hypothetical protein ABI723_06300 [Bacteroidia bacterium]
MKIAILICRILLGLIFTVFGLNQFFHFIPMEMPTGDAGVFFTGMVKSVYLIPTLGFFQVLGGILLLVNRFVLLALVILFPIILNILLFHIFLAPEGLIMAIVLMLMELFLVYAYRDHFMHFKNPTHHIN